MNALKQLAETGQAPWLDFVQRHLIQQGDLKTLIERDGLKGVTSNPSIFEKAIAGSKDYGDDLAAFLKHADHGPMAIYEHLAIADIKEAADVLLPVFKETKGRDGFISLEVSPYLANDTEATIAEARRLWKAVGKPNLMVKVPATTAGIPAIRTLIGEGLSINVTLLFAVPVYEEVAKAYIAGLEHFAGQGGDVSKVASVASFFVSRIDNVIDKQLQAKIDAGDTALKPLLGKAAIANAKVAYERYKKLFSGKAWDALAAKGAHTQRLLWASTSVKNPTYPDTLYVETLIGRDTVNTMPPATMDAFRDHGKVVPDAVEQDLAGGRAILKSLEKSGISLEKVTADLVVDGVKQFADAFDKLLGAVAEKRAASVSVNKATVETDDALKSAIAAEQKQWLAEGKIRKLWEGDKSVWTGKDEDHWLGWLDIVRHEHDHVGTLARFAEAVKSGGFAHLVLLGMGGSSLGPEVLAKSFGHHAGWPRFHMLDSTDPAQIRTLERTLDLKKTMFIVSSKSGSTLEPNIFLAYFKARMIETVGDAHWAEHFIAVTDPGSALEAEARKDRFAHIFHGVKSIGGRYSVLSKFGLVPAAAMGIDVARFLEITAHMVTGCGANVPVDQNPGAELGLLLGIAVKQFKRDKVTIIASPKIADLGAWLEQLIAESTGKQGHGLIPLDSEPLGDVSVYGKDRVFAYLVLDGNEQKAQSVHVAALAKAGHPVVRIAVRDVAHIGQEFFRWEIATAVAGAIIGINPFDQPDVEASKIKTRALTDAYEKSGGVAQNEPVFRANGVAIHADAKNAEALGRHNSLATYLAKHFGRAHAGDYIAILAYIERNEAHGKALEAIRTRLRDARKVATCLGFGPRFLHSTGQAYKGGPNSGVFLQITADDAHDLPVPGHSYSFGQVKAAQAQGDLSVLVERGRRVLRVHLKDVGTGLKELQQAVDHAFH
ncbi:bifunctional transaldolase/phosoglucose isomerase [Acidiphilium sp. AL]|uniref:bifunctional transaldolase/phosoglucose isomerase n=1 Tax=Acidiphilium sp. AL TaxID=2871704 RepID=UPI0021CB1EC8|nr:bifunctional transaldolase/phosoglucose isomerase [Acidiphilium sp. AL]MCU4161120.1 bifunctional transaldolase/phosoglucose isomerase [Acidiphilium sp. AL]